MSASSAPSAVPQSTASPVLECVAIILRIGHLGDELRNHLAISAESIAGKDQCIASDCLDFSIGTAERDADHGANFIGKNDPQPTRR